MSRAMCCSEADITLLCKSGAIPDTLARLPFRSAIPGTSRGIHILREPKDRLLSVVLGEFLMDWTYKSQSN